MQPPEDEVEDHLLSSKLLLDQRSVEERHLGDCAPARLCNRILIVDPRQYRGGVRLIDRSTAELSDVEGPKSAEIQLDGQQSRMNLNLLSLPKRACDGFFSSRTELNPEKRYSKEVTKKHPVGNQALIQQKLDLGNRKERPEPAVQEMSASPRGEGSKVGLNPSASSSRYQKRKEEEEKKVSKGEMTAR